MNSNGAFFSPGKPHIQVPLTITGQNDHAMAEPPSANFTGFVHYSPSDMFKTRLSRLQDVLAHLRLGRLSPVDLLIHVLDPQIPENDWHRIHLYKEDGRLGELMDMIMEDERGHKRLGVWMKEHAIEAICEVIDAEMDVVRENLTMKLEDVTPEYISKWTVEATVGSVAQKGAPTLHRLLVRAAQTNKAKAKNIKKKPETVRA